MDSRDFQKRFEEAYKLLTQETTNRGKFESVQALIKGFNPRIDSALEKTSNSLSDVEKIQKGEIIELAAEKLPENSEEEKERKKRILALIRYWKDLTSEVERVKNELSQNQNQNGQAESFGRILKSAKGPLGIITIAAITIIAVFGFLNFQQSPADNANQPESIQTQIPKEKIKVIIVDGKKIPLSEVRSVKGAECDGDAHYHANANQTAKATDETDVFDPNPSGCGYGKVEEVEIEEVELP